MSRFVLVFIGFLVGAVAGLIAGKLLLPPEEKVSIIAPAVNAGKPPKESETENGTEVAEPLVFTPSPSASEPSSRPEKPSIAMVEGIAVAETPAVIPLQGMMVSLSMDNKVVAQALTGTDGRFVLATLRRGEGQARLYSNRHRVLLVKQEVTLALGETSRLRLALTVRTETRVEGQVVSPSGKTVAGAQVRLYLGRGKLLYSTVTDSNGDFVIPHLRIREDVPSPEEVQEALSRLGSIKTTFFRCEVDHPDEGESVFLISFANPLFLPEKVSKRVQLESVGFVAGTVKTPDGTLLDNRWSENNYIPYTIHFDRGSSGSNIEVEDGKFRIEIKGQSGFLTLGGRAGRVLYRIKKVGQVSPQTRIENVEIIADILPQKRIPLVDESGTPIQVIEERFETEISASTQASFISRESPSIMNGNVVVTVDFKTPVYLHIFGAGFASATVRLDPEKFPLSITLKRVPPLVRGLLVLPPGKELRNVEMHMSISIPGGERGNHVYIDEYDSATGAFAVVRPSHATADAVYSLCFIIRDYKSWRLDGFQVKPGETLENVRVEFDKEHSRCK